MFNCNVDLDVRGHTKPQWLEIAKLDNHMDKFFDDF